MLEIYFEAEGDPSRWVRIFLSRLTPRFNKRAKACLDLLYHRTRLKNQLWFIRAKPFDIEISELQARQVFCSYPLADTHTNLQAFLRMLEARNAYPADEWAEFERFMLAQLRTTYLGKLLGEARRAIDEQGMKANVEEGPDIVAEAANVEGAASEIVATHQALLFEVLRQPEE